MRVFGVIGALLLVGAGAVDAVSPYVETAETVEGVLEVRVGAEGWGLVQAVHVDVEYDPAGLEYAGFTAGDLFGDPLVLGPFDRVERGVVDVTTATLTGPVSPARAAVGVVRFVVKDASRAGVRLVALETADEEWGVEAVVSYATAVEGGSVPFRTRLVGSVPNPFNPVTEIRYELGSRGMVEVTVYDVSGRAVRGLVRGVEEAGSHAVLWDGRSDTGEAVSSGVYFARLRAGSHVETQRMTLVR
jgi:hypothetical protein